MLQVMDDLRSADVDFLTIGQYLQPTRKHHPVMRFVPPDEFKALRDHRLRQGLPDGVVVAADALVASRRRGFRAAEGGARVARLRPRPMPQFSTKRRVRHSAADMFDLVADVERYPEFVPLCRDAEGAAAHARGQSGVEIVVADMTVSFKLVRETFPAASRSTGRSCKSWSNICKARSATCRTAGPSSRRRARLRGRVLHRLRIPQPHARHADGRHVRRGVPPLRRGLRGARRPGLRRAAKPR